MPVRVCPRTGNCNSSPAGCTRAVGQRREKSAQIRSHVDDLRCVRSFVVLLRSLRLVRRVQCCVARLCHQCLHLQRLIGSCHAFAGLVESLYRSACCSVYTHRVVWAAVAQRVPVSVGGACGAPLCAGSCRRLCVGACLTLFCIAGVCGGS
jgi:hypothetical protein